MGILNLTPDSFYDGGSYPDEASRIQQVGRMLQEGAAIIDLGAMSTRPGAPEISEAEELARLLPMLRKLVEHFPGICISVDTYRARVAEKALAEGAMMVNDISGGTFDPEMIPFIAGARVPYVLMHIQGKPRSMQEAPQYQDVVTEVMQHFGHRLGELFRRGATDVVLDPGFGFGKDIVHNYSLLRSLPLLTSLGLPVMAGVSRKSMINKVLGTTPSTALNGSTAVHMLALMGGASLLRVHDVKEAMEAIRIFQAYRGHFPGPAAGE